MQDFIYCEGCGKQLHASAMNCPHCGAVIRSKNRILAALLAFFLGGLGIHKFYLGKIGQGILYLLFSWTFIPTVIAFIEGIVYLCTSDSNFARKYH